MGEAEEAAAGLSNAEIARLLEQAVTRFQNWRVEAELNPNPRMVHSLANLISIVDALTAVSGQRMQYSYKALVERMSGLVGLTAELNEAVVSSLDDDRLSAEELRLVTDRLVALVNGAVGLIRFLQESFASPDARAAGLALAPGSLLPAGLSPPPEATPAREGGA